MVSPVSISTPTPALNLQSDWISELCNTVTKVAMRIINWIRDCFSPGSSNGATTIDPSRIGATVANPQNIIAFYQGAEANNNNFTLDQILNFDDGQLEAYHNYIQWLFPLTTPSAPNPTAPVLDQATINIFRNDAHIKNQVLRSFRRMLSFYGLQMDPISNVITRAPNFAQRSAIWLTPANHNFLRITRILHCLNLFGLGQYATSFYTILTDINANEGQRVIGPNTFQFWTNARHS